MVGVVSTIKPESSCCWITLGDFDGGVYCLNAWCPAGNLPRLGTEVSLELKLGKFRRPTTVSIKIPLVFEIG